MVTVKMLRVPIIKRSRYYIAALVLTLTIPLWYPKSTCDHYGSTGVIEEMCTKYRSNLVGGSLCEALCDKRSIVYKSCVNHKLGRSVLYMDYAKSGKNPETIVLKIQRYPFDTKMTVGDIAPSALQATDGKFIRIMNTNISSVLSQQLGQTCNITASVLSEIWGYDFTKYVNSFRDKGEAIRSAYRSIWLLIQQREYVFMKLNQHFEAIPRIYGTCGAAFFMEYANSLGSLTTGLKEGRWVSIHLSDWAPRAKYAVKILELVPSLDTDFSQPLHLCDAKDPNIGMRGDEDVALIDLDHGLLESELYDKMQHQSCTADLNCGFLKCPGLCDTSINKCKAVRTNNNLQSICEVSFLNRLGWINTGLLRAPPPEIEKELMQLLYKCAYPPSRISPIAHDLGVVNTVRGYTRRVVHKPGDDIRQELIRVIKKGLEVY